MLFGFLVLISSSRYTALSKRLDNEIVERTQQQQEVEVISINYINVNEVIDYSELKNIGLKDERSQAVFDFLAQKYTEKYDLPVYIPYLFALIESDFYSTAYNEKTMATGLFQITPICLADFNRYNRSAYTMYDMYDVEMNFEVSMWYINRLITYYKVPKDDPYTLYSVYNMGPGNYLMGTPIPGNITHRYNLQAEKIEFALVNE
jgi:hypothetical protein